MLTKILDAGRLLYGSDAPGRNDAVQLARVRGAFRPGTQRDAVLGANARRVLGFTS